MPCLQGIQRCHYIDYAVKIVPVSILPRRHLPASLQLLRFTGGGNSNYFRAADGFPFLYSITHFFQLGNNRFWKAFFNI